MKVNGKKKKKTDNKKETRKSIEKIKSTREKMYFSMGLHSVNVGAVL